MSPESAVDNDVSTELSEQISTLDLAEKESAVLDKSNEYSTAESEIQTDLSDLALDLILLSQELVNTKLKLENLTKVNIYQVQINVFFF